MTKSYKRAWILALLPVLGVGLWLGFTKGERSGTAEESLSTGAFKASDRNADQAEGDDGSSLTDTEAGEVVSASGVEEESDQSLQHLGEILPEWIRANGERFQDRREIEGHTVVRSRARHQWENGERLEIEITDAGASADESLVRNLGFDTNMENTETESGFTMSQKEEGFRINREYDFADQRGSIQILVEERYLVEIHIDKMPEEAFQEILDRDIPFDEILKRMEK